MSKNAIWFSRHRPSAEQLQEIAAGPYQLVGIAEGMDLGSRVLASDKDVKAVMDGIAQLLVVFQAKAVFGVFPTPILAQWNLEAEKAQFMGYNVPRYPCYASWNSERSGFSHQQWLQVASC